MRNNIENKSRINNRTLAEINYIHKIVDNTETKEF